MDLLLGIGVYVAVFIVSLLLVLIPMRWLARKLDAGRSGYGHCLLALIGSYVAVLAVLVGAGLVTGLAGLEPGFLVVSGVSLVALLAGVLAFARILDTTVLRGLGIAVFSAVVSWVLVGVLGTGVVMLGLGGASLEDLTAALESGGAELGLDTGTGGERGRAATPSEHPDVQVLREVTSGFCGCVAGGGDCRSEQVRLTREMERVNPADLPGADGEAALALQMKGLECLASAMSGETAPDAPSGTPAADAGMPAPQAASAREPDGATAPAGASRAARPARAPAGEVSVALLAARAYAPDASKQAAYGYREMSVEELAGHVGKLARITTGGGEEHADIFTELTDTAVVLRQGRREGGGMTAIPREDIARIRVLGRW